MATLPEYLDQIEPASSGFDFPDIFLASLVISAKRQADALERIANALTEPDAYGLSGTQALAHAITLGLTGGGRA